MRRRVGAAYRARRVLSNCQEDNATPTRVKGTLAAVSLPSPLLPVKRSRLQSSFSNHFDTLFVENLETTIHYCPLCH